MIVIITGGVHLCLTIRTTYIHIHTVIQGHAHCTHRRISVPEKQTVSKKTSLYEKTKQTAEYTVPRQEDSH